jgi:hypothetical protein
MTVRIKAHFDGKAIVPDEPVTLPVGTQLVVETSIPISPGPPTSLEERLAALHRIASRASNTPGIPLEALRRENLYD